MICAVQVTYMKGEGQDRYVISTDSDVTVNAREHILSAVTPLNPVSPQTVIQFIGTMHPVVLNSDCEVHYVNTF